jgi:hypothetical protein
VFELPILTPTTSPKRTRAGRGFLPGCDLRTTRGRRLRAIVNAYIADLPGEPSASELSLCMQAGTLALQMEDLQAMVARGESIPTASMARLSKELARVVTTLRGERRPARRAAGRGDR